MQPHLGNIDRRMFYSYLDKASVYFEYGSGGSTYQASIRPNISAIYSVESDKEWVDTLKKRIKSKKIVYLYNEMDVRPNTWGYPGPNSTDAQQIMYSSHIRNLTKDEQQNIDLVFIDGRFRVACCLKCFDVIKQSCLIAFDDFLNRPEYYIVLDYYDIVDKTPDERMVILQKKTNISTVPEDIIKRYESNQS
jgi:hypothetical protein